MVVRRRGKRYNIKLKAGENYLGLLKGGRFSKIDKRREENLIFNYEGKKGNREVLHYELRQDSKF